LYWILKYSLPDVLIVNKTIYKFGALSVINSKTKIHQKLDLDFFGDTYASQKKLKNKMIF
jgi:hypothetical protein